MNNYKRFTRSFVILILAFWASDQLSAQEERLLDPSFNNLDWEQFVAATEDKFDVKYFYADEISKDLSLPKIETSVTLSKYLNDLFSPFFVYVVIDRQGNIFLTKNTKIYTSIAQSIYPKVKEKEESTSNNEVVTDNNFLQSTQNFISETIVLGDKALGRSKRNATLSGYIYDQKKEPIIGATILVGDSGQGTASDHDGFYSLTLKKGKYNLTLRNISSKEKEVRIELLSDDSYDFVLENAELFLEDILVTSSRSDRVQNTNMGTELLAAKDIKEIPLVLGEADILKVSSLLPGIQSVGEGAAGFNVRGSPADQNLFFIDKIPVYNTSHLFGFFSAFNSDVVDEFSLSKSNIPAEFGGRLASVFDVSAKVGDKEKYKVRGGISPVTGRILFEGPIQKEKSSVLIGLRSTYSNYILSLIDNPDFKNSKIFFGDAVTKFSFDINEKNTLNLFGYFSSDDINFGGSSLFKNQNIGGSAIYTHSFNPKHHVDLSLVYSQNTLEVENSENIRESYRQNALLEHQEAKLDFMLLPADNHRITYGANAILYHLDRGEYLPAGPESVIEAKILGKEQALEGGIYVSDEWQISSDLTLIAGLRYNVYSFLGPNTVFQYGEDGPKSAINIIDTLQYGKNERIVTHTGLDYRVGLSYVVNPDFSIKASYNKLHQYIFLLSNTIALSPTDKWKLTDANIDPLVGDQYSVGFYTKIFRKHAELSVEAYYKDTRNLVEFKDGADLIVNEFPERDVLQGELDAYGVEMMLRKPKGRLNGWLNYTYSSSTVLVNTANSGGQINFGEAYKANYDKPHAVNMVFNYKVNRRFSISTNIVYATGKPITYPTTVYTQNGIPLINYTERNAYRVPDYFRTDLSLKLEGNLKKEKLLHSSWVLSVYNLTGRKNAYNVYFTSDSGIVKGFKTSIFAQPIVSLTYNFKFGNYDN